VDDDGCVGLLALIAGTVSYLHMHTLVELHGHPGWVSALTPFSVDGMIVAASTTLLADSRSGNRGGILPWACRQCGSRRADGDWAGDRGVAVVRAHCRLVRGLAARAVRAGIFSGRRGSGRWPIEPRAARCRAAVRSPGNMGGTSDGVAWSSAQVPLTNSPAKTANQPCASSVDQRPLDPSEV
jgi:hypothetical protein